MIRGMLPAQRVVACLKFDAFCKMHRRRVCSLLRAKREPEKHPLLSRRGRHPVGLLSRTPGLRSKYRAFSAARSPLFRGAGGGGLRLPASALCLGRHSHSAGRCPTAPPCFGHWPRSSLLQTRGYTPLVTPKKMGSIQKIQVASLKDFLCYADFKAPQPLLRQLPAGERARS